MFLAGIVTGAVIGIILMAFVKAGKIEELQSLVDASRHSLANAEDKIAERNKFIKIQREQIEEYKSKTTDLENNVKFLYNNLSAQKKKLVRPENQD